MDGGDDLRSLSNGSGNTLDRARADVAYGKDAPSIRFKRILPSTIAPGVDEAFSVQCHATFCEPIRVWRGTDEQKQMTD